MKRVYIVEYSTLARNRIRETLQRLDECEIVGESEIAEAAIAGIGDLDPDVVITDLLLKDASGVDIVKRVRARHGPERPLIYVLTNRVSPAYRASLSAAGANGLFDKTRECGLLIDELQQAA